MLRRATPGKANIPEEIDLYLTRLKKKTIGLFKGLLFKKSSNIWSQQIALGEPRVEAAKILSREYQVSFIFA